MVNEKGSPNNFLDPSTGAKQTLRRKAEERLQKQSPAPKSETPEETGRLLHELQVHQIELEMQNEELRRAQEDLETTRDRYFDLYDLAPVGYLTISEKGMILEANLTAAQMLGSDRSRLAGQPLSRFIFQDDQDTYYLNLKQLFRNQVPLTFELRMHRGDGRPFWVQIKTRIAPNSEGAPVWRVTLSDITERKRVEEDLLQSKNQLRILASQILLAQEKERKQIALEVHDVLGSSLSAIKFKAEEALYHLPKDGTLNISKPLEALVPLITETIEAARRIQADLRPSLLDDLGIVATLSWFCRKFEMIYTGIKVDQAVTIQEEEVPDHLKIILFRIVQEALNNIGKHSKADSGFLGLRKVNNTIELCIRDNGEGFDPESMPSGGNSEKGLGLSSMKERIEFSGGTFSLQSAKGKGTDILAVWPG
ncbi:MAG: PAS domain S-box protein [Deltaproteobacteria bacterium]|nr:PAS domain S-box protein [Deltaproteobacteria bacterium]